MSTRDGRPADDLHQMLACNILFGAKQSLLLYPTTSGVSDVQGSFEQPGHFSEIGNSSLGTYFLKEYIVSG